jgi:hypothetical protein
MVRKDPIPEKLMYNLIPGNSLFAKIQGKVAYIRSKVIGPCASGSYVHRAALCSFIL